VVMPEWASISKQEATRAYGVEVIIEGQNLSDAIRKAGQLVEGGKTLIHPFDDADVIAGQGTIGIEILEELKEPDLVVVPVGGGGLIAGIACACRSRAERQGLLADGDLFSSLEDQAQHGLVQRGLERARAVLSEEQKTLHGLDGLRMTVSRRRKSAGRLLDERFQMHVSASDDILDQSEWDDTLSPDICRIGQVAWRNRQARRLEDEYGSRMSGPRRRARSPEGTQTRRGA